LNGKRLAKVLIYPLEAGRLSFLMVFAILSSPYLLPYVFYPVAYGQELDNQCLPGQGIEPDSGQCVDLPGAATPQQPTQSQERHQQLLEQHQLQQQQVQQPTQTPPQQPTPQPLSVEINSNGVEGVAPATFDFGVSIAGGTEPYFYSWDFGDGSAGSDQPPVQHTFEEAGTYDVWVGVTDANNVEASSTVQVVVTPTPTPPQQPTPTPPQQPTPTPPQQPTPTPPQQPDVQDPNAGDSSFLPGFDFPEVTTTEPVVDMFPLIVLAAIVVIGGIALGKYSKNRNRGRRLRISPSAVVDIHTKGGTRE
jgi:PKD domain